MTCTLFSHTLAASPFLPHSSPRPLAPVERGRVGQAAQHWVGWMGASTEPGCCAAQDGHPQKAKMLQMATHEEKYTAFNHQPGHKGNLMPTVVCKISPRQQCTAEEAALYSVISVEWTLDDVGNWQDALWRVSTNSLCVAC